MKHSNSRQQQTNLRTQEDGRLNLMAALHPEHDQVLFWSDSRRAQRWLLTSTYFVVNKPSNTRLRNQEQTFSDKFSSRYISLWLSWSYSDRRPGETLHIHIFKYRSNIKPIHKKNKTFMPTNPRVEFCLNVFIAGPERRAEHRSAPHPVVCRNTRPQTAVCVFPPAERRCSSDVSSCPVRRKQSGGGGGAEPSVMLKVISVLTQKFNYVAAEEERGVNELADGSHSLSTQSSAEEHPL